MCYSLLLKHAMRFAQYIGLLLQVKVEQTDKQLQEMQDSKSKGQKTKQKHQVSTELEYQQAIPR